MVVWYITLPLKALSDQEENIYTCYSVWKTFVLILAGF